MFKNSKHKYSGRVLLRSVNLILNFIVNRTQVLTFTLNKTDMSNLESFNKSRTFNNCLPFINFYFIKLKVQNGQQKLLFLSS